MADASFKAKFAPGFQLSNADGQTLDALVGVVNAGGSTASGIVAAGTSQAGATVLSSRINNVTSAPASGGLALPPASNSFLGSLNPIVIFNGGTSGTQVYGNGSDTVDGSAGSAGVTLSAGHMAQFFAVTSAGWKSDIN